MIPLRCPYASTCGCPTCTRGAEHEQELREAARRLPEVEAELRKAYDHAGQIREELRKEYEGLLLAAREVRRLMPEAAAALAVETQGREAENGVAIGFYFGDAVRRLCAAVRDLDGQG